MIRQTIFTCARKLTNSQLNLPHRTNKTNRVMKKTKKNKQKPKMLERNGPVTKSLDSVLRPEESVWWERFVEEVGLEPGVEE